MPDKGCNTHYLSGSCALKICRSPDTHGSGGDNPGIDRLLAYNVATYLAKRCEDNGRINAKITVRTCDGKHEKNELNVLLAADSLLQNMKLLSINATPMFNATKLSARTLLTDPDIGQPEVYNDNGWTCIRRRNFPFVLRRKTFDVGPDGDIGCNLNDLFGPAHDEINDIVYNGRHNKLSR